MNSNGPVIFRLNDVVSVSCGASAVIGHSPTYVMSAVGYYPWCGDVCLPSGQARPLGCHCCRIRPATPT